MSERYTAKDVRTAFRRWALSHGFPHGTESDLIGGQYKLEEWSPGDGYTRYRVNFALGSGTAHGPLGSTYWLGAREATFALQEATNCPKTRANVSRYDRRMRAKFSLPTAKKLLSRQLAAAT